jgi:hypothetical protein
MLFVFGRVTKQVRYGLPAWCSMRYTLPSRAHPASECQVASRAGLSQHFLPIFLHGSPESHTCHIYATDEE